MRNSSGHAESQAKHKITGKVFIPITTVMWALLLCGIARAQAPAGPQGPVPGDAQRNAGDHEAGGVKPNAIALWYENLSENEKKEFLEKHDELVIVMDLVRSAEKGDATGRMPLIFNRWYRNLTREEQAALFEEYPSLNKRITVKSKKSALVAAWFSGLTEDEKTKFIGQNIILTSIVDHRLKFADKEDRPKIAPTAVSQWYATLGIKELRKLYGEYPSLRMLVEDPSQEPSPDSPPIPAPSASPEEESDR